MRVKLPIDSLASEGEQDETFFFVKEHREGNRASQNYEPGKNATLFIANTPIVPGIKTDLILKALIGKFGDIEKVALIDNLRKGTSEENLSLSWAPKLKHNIPSCLPPIQSTEKFAHIVFSSSQQMRKVLRSLADIMTDKRNGGEYPGLKLEKLEMQVLRDESRCLRKEEMERNGDEMGDLDEAREKGGIVATADRYRRSLASLSRDKLLEHCNIVMQAYEDAEEEQRLARKASADQPDEDGFITVTSKSVGVEAGKDVLEKDKGATEKRRRDANKRNRKKKESVGASELEDFYRFQRKETRKRTLQELRKQFEEDLNKVKKMKENHEYKPF